MTEFYTVVQAQVQVEAVVQEWVSTNLKFSQPTGEFIYLFINT